MSRYDEWLAARREARAAGLLPDTLWSRWLRIYGYGLAPGERPEREPDPGVVERVLPWTDADRAAYDARCLRRGLRLGVVPQLPPLPESVQREVWDDVPAIDSWPDEVPVARRRYLAMAVARLAPGEGLATTALADALGISADEADAMARDLAAAGRARYEPPVDGQPGRLWSAGDTDEADQP